MVIRELTYQLHKLEASESALVSADHHDKKSVLGIGGKNPDRSIPKKYIYNSFTFIKKYNSHKPHFSHWSLVFHRVKVSIAEETQWNQFIFVPHTYHILLINSTILLKNILLKLKRCLIRLAFYCWNMKVWDYYKCHFAGWYRGFITKNPNVKVRTILYRCMFDSVNVQNLNEFNISVSSSCSSVFSSSDLTLSTFIYRWYCMFVYSWVFYMQ